MTLNIGTRWLGWAGLGMGGNWTMFQSSRKPMDQYHTMKLISYLRHAYAYDYWYTTVH